MGLYSGIDLHSTNSYVVVSDESGHSVLEKRFPNDLQSILGGLEPYREDLQGVAVESTFNWYWLVDGLMDCGHKVHLVNTSAVKQYEGLKFADDRHDARWLARLLRLGILPTGYIYPREERPVRDLLRRRSKLVKQKVANLLSIKNIIARNTGRMMSAKELYKLSPEEVPDLVPDEHQAMAIQSTVRVMDTLQEEILRIEKAAKARGKLRDDFRVLLSMPGIGNTLGLTIMYETGDVGRFPKVGDYSSYCRLVQTQRTSNGRKKGEGNRKNGNPYLSWAFSEAANFAIRYQPLARGFYDRKKAKTSKPILANRALAHKLARACYFMMKNQTMYNAELLFG